MNYDGWVIVGTKLDNKQLERDLKNAERRLQQYEKEAEKLTKAKAKAEIDLQPYEEQKRIIQEMTDEALKYAQSEQEVKRQLEIEKIQLEELNQKYSKQLGNLESINNKIKENTKNQELMKNQIKETGDKLKQARIKDNIEDIGKSTSNVIKKIGKWALAIFSIRSAYMFVRQSASTLSQYNEKIASDLEYIRFALASSLQPVIEGLIQLVYKLLTYVNYIAKAWFGVNLFANASEKAMNKGAKSAEKMKKSLAGFDEMNIIQDTTGGGAGGGVISPSIDLSQIKEPDLEIFYSWTDKIKEIFDNTFNKIKENIMKVMSDLGFSNAFIKTWEFAADGVKLIIDGLLDFIGGILEIIIGLVTGDTEKVKEGIKKLITEIVKILYGLLKTILGIFGMILAMIWDSLIYPIINVFKI